MVPLLILPRPQRKVVSQGDTLRTYPGWWEEIEAKSIALINCTSNCRKSFHEKEKTKTPPKFYFIHSIPCSTYHLVEGVRILWKKRKKKDSRRSRRMNVCFRLKHSVPTTGIMKINKSQFSQCLYSLLALELFLLFLIKNCDKRNSRLV